MKQKVLLGLAAGFAVLSIFLIILKFAGGSSSEISNVRITNISNGTITVSWLTEKPTKAKVYYNEGNINIFTSKSAVDDRDLELDENGEYIVKEEGRQKRTLHYITIRNLEPDTEYNVKIAAGLKAINIPDIDTIKTSTVSDDIKTPDPIYSTIVDKNKQGVKDVEIIANLYKIKDGKPINESMPLSATTNEQGGWTLDMTNFRNFDDTVYKLESNTQINITTRNGDGLQFMNQFDLKQYRPLDSIVFDKEFGEDNTSDASDSLFNQSLLNLASAGTKSDGESCSSSSECRGGCHPCGDGRALCAGITRTGNQVCGSGGNSSPSPQPTPQQPSTGNNRPPGSSNQTGGNNSAPTTSNPAPQQTSGSGSRAECSQGCRYNSDCQGGLACHPCGDGRTYCVGRAVRGADACAGSCGGGAAPTQPSNGGSRPNTVGNSAGGSTQAIVCFSIYNGSPLRLPGTTCPPGYTTINPATGTTPPPPSGASGNAATTTTIQCKNDAAGFIIPVNGTSCPSGFSLVGRPTTTTTTITNNTSNTTPTVQKYCRNNTGGFVINISGQCPSNFTEVASPVNSTYSSSTQPVTGNTSETTFGLPESTDYYGQSINANAAAAEWNNNRDQFTMKPGTRVDWLSNVPVGAGYGYVTVDGKRGAGACLTINVLDRALATTVITDSEGNQYPLIQIVDRSEHAGEYLQYGDGNSWAYEGATFWSSPGQKGTNYIFDVNPALAELGITDIDVEFEYDNSQIDTRTGTATDNYSLTAVVTVNGGQGYTIERIEIGSEEEYRHLIDYLSQENTAFNSDYEIPVEVANAGGNNLRKSIFGQAYAQSPFEQTIQAQGISENVDPSTDAKLEVTESGNYAIYQNGEILGAREVIVEEGKATIKVFSDTNKNSRKDPSENYIHDLSTIELKKISDAVGYNLRAGWNLINIPLVNEDVKTAKDLINHWNSQGATINQVAIFQQGNWQIYSTRNHLGQEVSYSNDFNLIPGQAIFIFSALSDDVSISGQRFDSPIELDVSNGWNLVGINPAGNYTASSLIDRFNSQQIQADTVSKYESGLYQSVIKEEGVLYGNDYRILDSQGYFVRVKEGGGTEKRFTP